MRLDQLINLGDQDRSLDHSYVRNLLQEAA